MFEHPLKQPSPSGWAPTVKARFPEFLQDHACCERKAAALAMSFIMKYPDRKALIEPMVSLAREELEHFQQVYRIMSKREISLPTYDEKDGYVNQILTELRHGREERFLDRLIMSGLIEARGHERFQILSQNLADDPELQTFYLRLSQREAGHYRIFIHIAQVYFSQSQIHEAIERLSEIESRVMLESPLTHRLH